MDRPHFTGRDLLAYNLPMEKVIHDAYAAGTLPVWNPWISGGRPLLPNPNSGALYPAAGRALARSRFLSRCASSRSSTGSPPGIGMLVLLRSLGLEPGSRVGRRR